jgi:hypothetical protein
LGLALATLHALPHWPQWLLVFKRCSQPSRVLLLQLP